MSQRGLTVAELLERLRPSKRGKGRLPPAKPRGKIAASVGTAYPSAAASGGIDSPLTETVDTRVYYETLHTLRSSSGFFVLEYYNVSTVEMKDKNGREVVFAYRDVEP